MIEIISTPGRPPESLPGNILVLGPGPPPCLMHHYGDLLTECANTASERWHELDIFPALAGFFRARHLGSDTVHVTLNLNTKVTSRGSKKRMVPAIPGGSRSVSLACRSSATNFEPVA